MSELKELNNLLDYESDNDLMDVNLTDIEKNNIDTLVSTTMSTWDDLNDDDDDDLNDDNINIQINNNIKNINVIENIPIDENESTQLNEIIEKGDSYYNMITPDAKLSALEYFNNQYKKNNIKHDINNNIQIDCGEFTFNIEHKLDFNGQVQLSKLITWTNMMDVQIKEHNLMFKQNLRINEYHTTNLIDINSYLFQYPLKKLIKNNEHLIQNSEYLLLTYIGFNQNNLKDFTLLALKFNFENRCYECMDVYYTKIIEATVNLIDVPIENTIDSYQQYYKDQYYAKNNSNNGSNNLYNFIRKYKPLTKKIYYYSNNHKSAIEVLIQQSNIVPCINILSTYFKFKNISKELNCLNDSNYNIFNNNNCIDATSTNFYIKKCKYRCSLCNSQNFLINLILYYNVNSNSQKNQNQNIIENKKNYHVNRNKYRNRSNDNPNHNGHNKDMDHYKLDRCTSSNYKNYSEVNSKDHNKSEKYKPYSSIHRRLDYKTSQHKDLIKSHASKNIEPQTREIFIQQNKKKYLKFKNYYKNKNSNYFYTNEL